VLTVLQEKLAAAHGLAMSASVVTRKVEERIEDETLLRELRAMRDDAEETRARCLVVERILPEELFEEVRAHANSVHETGADLVGAWFKKGTDPIKAWTFLAMGEAAEVATWEVVAALAAEADEPNVADLAAWALPIQRRHLAVALDGAVVLATAFDPIGPRWG
jgi:hypothetical protein